MPIISNEQIAKIVLELELMTNALADVENAAESIRVTLNGLEDEREEPPPSLLRPMPSNVSVTALPSSLQLAWANPALPGVDSLTVAWGTSKGFLAAKSFKVNDIPTSHTITGLEIGTEHTVQVGYKMTGETAAPQSAFVNMRGTPLAPTVTPPINPDFPSTGTWQTKATWIKSVAGCKRTDLKRVGTEWAPPGTTWFTNWGNRPFLGKEKASKMPLPALHVNANIDLAGLEIPGLLVLNPNAKNIELRDCYFEGLWSAGGNASLVSQCTVRQHPEFNTGNGALNALAPAAVVYRCDLSRAFDGMQWGGGGQIIETYIHDLTVTDSSHNDWVQNYDQQIKIYRSYFASVNAPGNHYNGVFSSNNPTASFYCEDSIFTHVNPQGAAFGIHANSKGNASFAELVRCRVAATGNIGDVRFGPGCESTGPLTQLLA